MKNVFSIIIALILQSGLVNSLLVNENISRIAFVSDRDLWEEVNIRIKNTGTNLATKYEFLLNPKKGNIGFILFAENDSWMKPLEFKKHFNLETPRIDIKLEIMADEVKKISALIMYTDEVFCDYYSYETTKFALGKLDKELRFTTPYKTKKQKLKIKLIDKYRSFINMKYAKNIQNLLKKDHSNIKIFELYPHNLEHNAKETYLQHFEIKMPREEINHSWKVLKSEKVIDISSFFDITVTENFVIQNSSHKSLKYNLILILPESAHTIKVYDYIGKYYDINISNQPQGKILAFQIRHPISNEKHYSFAVKYSLPNSNFRVLPIKKYFTSQYNTQNFVFGSSLVNSHIDDFTLELLLPIAANAPNLDIPILTQLNVPSLKTLQEFSVINFLFGRHKFILSARNIPNFIPSQFRSSYPFLGDDNGRVVMKISYSLTFILQYINIVSYILILALCRWIYFLIFFFYNNNKNNTNTKYHRTEYNYRKNESLPSEGKMSEMAKMNNKTSRDDKRNSRRKKLEMEWNKKAKRMSEMVQPSKFNIKAVVHFKDSWISSLNEEKIKELPMEKVRTLRFIHSSTSRKEIRNAVRDLNLINK